MPAPQADTFRPLVRTWTWIALGAMVWMLGYYLPTYWLIYKLPVLGYVRCPARMVLAVDMALATLAAVAVHLVVVGPDRLPAAIRRGVTRVLPVAMVGVLVLFAAVGGLSIFFAGGQIPGWDGCPGRQMVTAILPTNPAVWVQFALAAATAGVVVAWLVAPARRAPLLVILLAADLLLVTRFVDVPAGVTTGPDPDKSPAAEWLKANLPSSTRPYAVWGIGETYNDRPAELLKPKTAHALGITTINTYGPFQPPAHAHLFGFQIFGTNRDWAWLIRRNILLSEYGVRFILTARRDVRGVIESVRIPQAPPPLEGPNVLSDRWRLERARRDPNGVFTLRTSFDWLWSMATQPVEVASGPVYKIALDARGPQGGAASYLRAEIYDESANRPWSQQDMLGLTVPAEQIGTDWRHFEWTFPLPKVESRSKGEGPLFRLFTQGERPILVRNVSLRRSHWPVPVDPRGVLKPGEPVYRLAAEIPATDAGDPPVAVYDNRLVTEWVDQWALVSLVQQFGGGAGADDVEKLRWGDRDLWKQKQWPVRELAALQSVGVRIRGEGRQARLLLAISAPGAGLYVLAAGILLLRSRRRAR